MTARETLPAQVAQPGGLVQAGDAVSALDAMVRRLPELEDTDLTGRTIARTLNADSPEEIFASPALESLRDLVGQRVWLHGVPGRLPSDYAEGQYYLLYELVSYETGERMTASSGSPYVASSALRALTAGLLPQLVRVVELESKRKAGQASLWLVHASPDAPSASVEQ